MLPACILVEMRIKVLFFGIAHDLSGLQQDEAEVPEGASLDGLWDRYAARFPRLKDLSNVLMLAVNQEVASRARVLKDGDEVAFLPPVSGGSNEDYYLLTRSPIPTADLVRQQRAFEDGAVVVFEGVVRNNSHRRRTLYLEYEAYEPMAVGKMREIGEELRRKFEIDHIGMMHRLGRLEIGETSVAIIVTSAHRQAAFGACQFAIDRLKQVVPIWKKEYFEDGSVWAEGESQGRVQSPIEENGGSPRIARNGRGLTDTPVENYLKTAIDIAREAGDLLLEHFRQPLEIRYKRRSDLVTEADRKSESLIVQRLQSHFPDHAIVAEEGGGQRTGSDYCWYVDPLDGTTNFAHGFPIFGVTLGLTYRGEVVAGVVYDPTRDELFTVERGAGAFLNNQRLRVSNNRNLVDCLVATGFPPFATNHDLNVEFYFRFTQLTHGIRRAGSAALDLCSVAAGRFDGFWELKLNPWDKAAGTLLVTEAGGQVSSITGKPFELLGDDVFTSNGLVHDQMLRVFSEVLQRRGSVDVRPPAP